MVGSLIEAPEQEPSKQAAPEPTHSEGKELHALAICLYAEDGVWIPTISEGGRSVPHGSNTQSRANPKNQNTTTTTTTKKERMHCVVKLHPVELEKMAAARHQCHLQGSLGNRLTLVLQGEG